MQHGIGDLVGGDVAKAAQLIQIGAINRPAIRVKEIRHRDRQPFGALQINQGRRRAAERDRRLKAASDIAGDVAAGEQIFKQRRIARQIHNEIPEIGARRRQQIQRDVTVDINGRAVQTDINDTKTGLCIDGAIDGELARGAQIINIEAVHQIGDSALTGRPRLDLDPRGKAQLRRPTGIGGRRGYCEPAGSDVIERDGDKAVFINLRNETPGRDRLTLRVQIVQRHGDIQQQVIYVGVVRCITGLNGDDGRRLARCLEHQNRILRQLPIERRGRCTRHRERRQRRRRSKAKIDRRRTLYHALRIHTGGLLIIDCATQRRIGNGQRQMITARPRDRPDLNRRGRQRRACGAVDILPARGQSRRNRRLQIVDQIRDGGVVLRLRRRKAHVKPAPIPEHEEEVCVFTDGQDDIRHAQRLKHDTDPRQVKAKADLQPAIGGNRDLAIARQPGQPVKARPNLKPRGQVSKAVVKRQIEFQPLARGVVGGGDVSRVDPRRGTQTRHKFLDRREIGKTVGIGQNRCHLCLKRGAPVDRLAHVEIGKGQIFVEEIRTTQARQPPRNLLQARQEAISREAREFAGLIRQLTAEHICDRIARERVARRRDQQSTRADIGQVRRHDERARHLGFGHTEIQQPVGGGSQDLSECQRLRRRTGRLHHSAGQPRADGEVGVALKLQIENADLDVAVKIRVHIRGEIHIKLIQTQEDGLFHRQIRVQQHAHRKLNLHICTASQTRFERQVQLGITHADQAARVFKRQADGGADLHHELVGACAEAQLLCRIGGRRIDHPREHVGPVHDKVARGVRQVLNGIGGPRCHGISSTLRIIGKRQQRRPEIRQQRVDGQQIAQRRIQHRNCGVEQRVLPGGIRKLGQPGLKLRQKRARGVIQNTGCQQVSRIIRQQIGQIGRVDRDARGCIQTIKALCHRQGHSGRAHAAFGGEIRAQRRDALQCRCLKPVDRIGQQFRQKGDTILNALITQLRRECGIAGAVNLSVLRVAAGDGQIHVPRLDPQRTQGRRRQKWRISQQAEAHIQCRICSGAQIDPVIRVNRVVEKHTESNAGLRGAQNLRLPGKAQLTQAAADVLLDGDIQRFIEICGHIQRDLQRIGAGGQIHHAEIRDRLQCGQKVGSAVERAHCLQGGLDFIGQIGGAGQGITHIGQIIHIPAIHQPTQNIRQLGQRVGHVLS